MDDKQSRIPSAIETFKIGDYDFKDFMKVMECLSPEDRRSLMNEINASVERMAMEDLIKKLNLPPLEPGYTYSCDWRYHSSISDQALFGPNPFSHMQLPVLSMLGGSH